MSVETSLPNVLLADDDVLMTKILSEFFEREGWTFDIASDGDAAVCAAEKKKYDLIVTDLVMPGLSGQHLLLKLHELTPSQPIVIVSGTSDFDQAASLLRDGFAIDFLPKPLDMELLANAVSRVIGGARTDSEEGKAAPKIQCTKASYELTTRDLCEVDLPFSLGEHLLQSGLIDMNTKLRLELAFQEALANAIEHGNLELASVWKDEVDEDGRDKFSRLKAERLLDDKYALRKVYVELQYNSNLLEIVIRDEGAGFTPPDLSEQSGEQTGEIAVHGRGVSIIHGIMDEVSYSHGGCQVRMVKVLNQ